MLASWSIAGGAILISILTGSSSLTSLLLTGGVVISVRIAWLDSNLRPSSSGLLVHSTPCGSNSAGSPSKTQLNVALLSKLGSACLSTRIYSFGCVCLAKYLDSLLLLVVAVCSLGSELGVNQWTGLILLPFLRQLICAALDGFAKFAMVLVVVVVVVVASVGAEM